MKTLQSTLAYQNRELVLRIQRSLHTNWAESRRVFDDVKAWLWLCARHRWIRQKKYFQSCGYQLQYMAMIDHFKAIDFGWHEFILMTQEYQNFCNDYLDGYVHHLPASIDSKTLQRKRRVQAKAYLTRYLAFMEGEIGSHRLSRWLSDLPKVQE